MLRMDFAEPIGTGFLYHYPKSPPPRLAVFISPFYSRPRTRARPQRSCDPLAFPVCSQVIEAFSCPTVYSAHGPPADR